MLCPPNSPTAYANPRSGGIIAISIDEGDELVEVQLTMGKQDIFIATRMDIPAQNTFILTVSENGFGKCTPVDEYRVQSRGGKGTINLKTVEKVGNVSGVLQVIGEDNVMLISNAGKVIRLKVQEIPVNHRVT